MRKLVTPNDYWKWTEVPHDRHMSKADKRHAKRANKQWRDRLILKEEFMHQDQNWLDFLAARDEMERDLYEQYKAGDFDSPYDDFYDDDYGRYEYDDCWYDPHDEEDHYYPGHFSTENYKSPSREDMIARLYAENSELYRQMYELTCRNRELEHQLNELSRQQAEPF